MFYRFLSVVGCILSVLSGCEAMFKKTIDIDVADQPPKLSVVSLLDADSGRFSIYVFEACPLASYKNWRPEYETIIRDGEIRLFEDDCLIYKLSGPFDLSFRPNSGYVPNDYNGYRHTATGLTPKAGNAYTLEVELEGYPMARSVAVMPEAPVVGEVILDTTQNISFNKVAEMHHFTESYHPSCLLHVTLTDHDPGAENYYYIHRRIYHHSKYNMEWENGRAIPYIESINPIATEDFSMIQDFPDYLASDSKIRNEPYDLYAFNRFVMTDRIFSGESIHLQMYMPKYSVTYNHLSPEPFSGYDAETDGVEVFAYGHQDLWISHISADAYKHIRNAILQNKGVDFFTEPLNIPGNIQNGYGLFWVLNSRRFKLVEYKGYYYPDMPGPVY